MRSFLKNSGAAVLAATTLSNVVHADNCASGSEEIAGNWYCQAVNTIQYTGFGVSGTNYYNDITSMNSATGQCTSQPYAYSGSMSPLDEEVSIHFRGPLALKQFAVYTPGSSSSKAKREVHNHAHAHAHNHAHFHEKREAAPEPAPEPQTWVTATINGVAVSWVNNYTPGAAAATSTTPAAASAATTFATSVVPAVKLAVTSVLSSAVAAATSAVAAVENVAVSGGSWEQVGYYNAEAGSSTGLAFMGNHGGSGSGVWDTSFGMSLSYLSADGSTGAASPQTLEDTTIPSGTEFSIFSSTPCTSGSGCGYYRPGSVANHGFGGSQKLFMFEFEMPSDPSASGMNADMPAIWMLNAKIPRTGQYVSADCSCWTSGCGEFDIFEVLTTGSDKAKSTMHGNDASGNAGDSDYFVRPTNGTLKLSVLFNDYSATVKVLGNSYLFTNSLTASSISSLGSATTSGVNNGLGVSDFALTS